MNLTPLVSRALGSAELFLKKNAPTILTGAGVAGFIATTALTIKATTKANDVLPKISENIAVAKSPVVTEIFTEKDAQKQLVKTYVESALEIGKVYAPVFLVGSASIACVLAGHGMMLKRQASLVALYTALDASYKVYRKRVAEHIGEDEEQKLYRRVRTIESIAEDGEACEIIDYEDVNPSPSMYSKFFDETSSNWSKTADYNLFFLRTQERWANDRLNAKGHLFLNEVYDELGLERTQWGQVVGWKKDAHKNGTGDGFVTFGIYDIADECNRAFVNGLEHTVLLDFNVDGPIKI